MTGQSLPAYPLRAAWVLLSLALLAAATYGWAIHAPYYTDDFGFFYGQSSNLWEFFEGRSGGAHAYRPLEGIILVTIQERFGFETWPIHAIGITAHTALAALTFWTAGRLGFGFASSLFSALFLLLGNIHVSAVMGNDTLSQVLGALSGCTGTLLMWMALRGARLRKNHFWFSIFCLSVALLFKETSAGYLVIAGLLILASRPFSIRRALTLGSPLVVIAAAFLLLRSRAAGLPEVGESASYSVQFAPAQIAKNLVMLLAGTFTPVSTVDVYLAVKQRAWAVLALAGASLVALLALVAYGFWRSGRIQLGVALFVFGCCSLVPAIFLGQVSELYAYNGAFYFCLGIGIGLGEALMAMNPRRPGYWVVLLAVLCFLAATTKATVQKTGLMASNGARAKVIVDIIAAKLKTTPANGRILLAAAPTNLPEYSIFVQPQFNVVAFGCRRLGRIFGRPDVLIDIVDARSLAGTMQSGDAILALRDGCVIEAEKVLGCGA